MGKAKTKTRELLVRWELSLPNIGSWDGKYSGKRNGMFAYPSRLDRKGEEAKKIQEFIDAGKSSFRYNFGDGYTAMWTFTVIPTIKEYNQMNRGDHGTRYDWMIRSIMKHGEIRKDWKA